MRAEFVIKFWANLPGIAYRLRDNIKIFILINYFITLILNNFK